ncbi:MAG: PIN domain-containing protein [Spirochaetaceae bacterium]|jgi:predicted nucleic acid-binding protein|nr:PIN domain-containing protein [Spirochaetaceae bacterium]
MSDAVFADTNIYVYAAVANSGPKHCEASRVLADVLSSRRIISSTQVLGEFYSAMSKNKCPHGEIIRLLDEIKFNTEMKVVDEQTVEHGLNLIAKYGYHYWDSLLLATALDYNCTVFYSEDMRDDQVIEGMTIRNIFREAG